MREYWRNAGLLLLLASSGGVGICAQVGGVSTPAPLAQHGAEVTFSYENQQLQPAKYKMVIYEDGSGHFHSEPGSTPLDASASYQPLAQQLDRSIQLSPATIDKIFSTAKGQRFFSVACEDTKNKVAFQGTKELSYSSSAGHGSCIYNWSKIVAIQRLTSILESIAFTLEEGRRLEIEHKHDRLSLDSELGALLDAAKDDRAAEMQNIQSTLQRIVDDGEVMDRARLRAKKLLESTGGDRASSTSP